MYVSLVMHEHMCRCMYIHICALMCVGTGWMGGGDSGMGTYTAVGKCVFVLSYPSAHVCAGAFAYVYDLPITVHFV